ncbi:MAG: porin [endosymbiont of Galathealinum brachiosum]|uniref:Porin n=1 Tax=endosymbiont of Galathealinum brachiosum TaxID=2200906 RepID=A0A370DMI9_9GAMM|nr:MAG: porin [endosymbiont of Galathealinum brachiosum]
MKVIKKLVIYLFCMAFLLKGYAFAGEIGISGFASVAAGKVVSGESFLADYPKAGFYDEDISFTPDSSLGVQLVATVNPQTSFIVQAVSHGANNYELELDWAYVNYVLSSELTLQAGRKRLPLYYYSDHFDIAYTYNWIRPPSDNYTWQITNYNGLSLLYEPNIGEWDALINVYAGREDSEDNELLSALSGNSVDETWKNMFGVVVELSKDWLDVRFTIMHGQLDRSIDDVMVEQDVSQQFIGLSTNLFFEQLSVLSEINRYERESSDISVDTAMLSLAYQIGEFTPHITHSRLEQDPNAAGGDEEHSTNSVGLRWDLVTNMALKIQYDKVIDKGQVIQITGDSELVSVSLDMVF